MLTLTNSNNGFPEGHQPKVIYNQVSPEYGNLIEGERTVQNPSSMEERQREAKHGLELLLKFVQGCALFVRHLFKNLGADGRASQRMVYVTHEYVRTSFSPKENTGTRSALRELTHALLLVGAHE